MLNTLVAVCAVRKPDGTAMSGIQVDVQTYSYSLHGLNMGKLPDGIDGQPELDHLVQYKEGLTNTITRPTQAITDSQGKHELWLPPFRNMQSWLAARAGLPAYVMVSKPGRASPWRTSI